MASPQETAGLEKLSRLVRYHILAATTGAGSGHPTSALSAVELTVALLFGNIFRYDPSRPLHPNNDRLIFSKGHASPLLYALWTAAGELTEEEMMTYRQFGSRLEGHPTPVFPHAEAATGSLGQGLSIGVGMALNARLDRLPYRTYVLLGDSEMAEGSQWEALQIGAHYKLDNLIGILDVNRLGQRGETMYGHDLDAYRQRVEAFGWKTVLVDGHDLGQVLEGYQEIADNGGRPAMLIARTLKGKGVSFIEDKNGFHGKPLDEEELSRALEELGEVDKEIRGAIRLPEDLLPPEISANKAEPLSYSLDESVATRNAFGNALKRIYPAFPDIVSLDAEVSNSTQAKFFKDAYPDRFFEMFIAEQNMAGAALGFARRGKIPFVSTFGAFMSRAYDQIRMSRYSDANIKFVGSHAGVSIGEDGPSQMALEDLAFFRTVPDCLVLYPCDAVSTEKLVTAAAEYQGMVYLRTTRQGTPVIYEPEEEFPVGGSKVLRRSSSDRAILIAAGITVHEALAASEELNDKHGVSVGVIDLYSIKPVDVKTLKEAGLATGLIITIEDHHPEGGLGEAVRSALWDAWVPICSMAVNKIPKSGTPRELLDFEEISSSAIVKKVLEFTSS
ncbi:MAG: transketolase [Desulfobulbaceae bacterium]|nr:transketolase [Desulfobulbaceae bacterium]